jgi:hypothetical protein
MERKIYIIKHNILGFCSTVVLTPALILEKKLDRPALNLGADLP